MLPKDMPLGLKYCILLNLVSTIVFLFLGVWVTVIIAPVLKDFTLLRSAVENSLLMNNSVTLFIFGVFLLLIDLIPVFLLINLNRGLLRSKVEARDFQIILSAVFLLAFPGGTFFYGISLYYMLFDDKTKEAFGGKELEYRRLTS